MGYRNAARRAVELVHEEAAKMNDPHARQLLNGMAFSLGVEMKRAFEALSDDMPNEDGKP